MALSFAIFKMMIIMIVSTHLTDIGHPASQGGSGECSETTSRSEKTKGGSQQVETGDRDRSNTCWLL